MKSKTTSVAASLALAFALFGLGNAVHAFEIIDTGLVSGGNPGGQPIYRVEGLVQGDTFNLSFGGVPDISADAIMTIVALTLNQAIVGVHLTNTSKPLGGDDPRLTVFGLLFDDAIGAGLLPADGTYLDTRDAANFPGFSLLACATSSSDCAGGGSGGIPAGLFDNFTIGVNGVFDPTDLALSTFALKVQGGPGGATYELAGDPNGGNGIPAPTVLALLGIGLVSLIATRRRLRTRDNR